MCRLQRNRVALSVWSRSGKAAQARYLSEDPRNSYSVIPFSQLGIHGAEYKLHTRLCIPLRRRHLAPTVPTSRSTAICGRQHDRLWWWPCRFGASAVNDPLWYLIGLDGGEEGLSYAHGIEILGIIIMVVSVEVKPGIR